MGRPRFSIVGAFAEGLGSPAESTLATLRRQPAGLWELSERPGEAGGEFLLPLDPGDRLRDGALEALAAAADETPGADLLYSDDDGFPKPGFSPERLRAQLYTGRLLALRRELVEEVGGWDSGEAGAREWDLALRVSERARSVVHVPTDLCRRAPAEPGWAADAAAAAARAVQAHCERAGLEASARADADRPGVCHLEPALGGEPTVDIVIPTAGGRRPVRDREVVLVEHLVAGIVATSTYAAYGIVVVADAATDPAVLERLAEIGGPRLRVVVDERPFNFSARINLGAAHGGGEHLLLLNDDVEVVSEDWLERLLMYSRLDGVGAVGPQLRWEDGRIQHAGVALEGGLPGHVYRGEREPLRDGAENALLPQDYPALTGACLMTPRAVFDQVGGFEEELPVNYNDVDFCLKVGATGRRLVYDADTVLFHFESSSRSTRVEGWERDWLLRRWGGVPIADPQASPRLRYGRRRRGFARRVLASAARRMRR